MTISQPPPIAEPRHESSSLSGRLFHALIVLGGVAVAQVFLFGPCLVGSKILLPLDILALPDIYLPYTPEHAAIHPYNYILADQVLLFEFERRFTAKELRAGRLPLWNPEIYLGAPFVVWDKYSPFSLLYTLFPTPLTLAWLQLLKSLVAGSGAYLFFRRAVKVGFWPAAAGAWCYPLTGFFVLWQGYPHTFVTACLPWVLLATDEVVHRPGRWGGPALALLTALVLVIRTDIAAQVLLVSGLYSLWALGKTYHADRSLRNVLQTGAITAGAWALGFLIAAPYLLPFAEYTRSGERLLRRSAGHEERPPGSLSELPRMVLPEIYGDTRYGTFLLNPPNLLESGAGAYTGLLATLVLAPLAWRSSRHRSLSAFWCVLALVASSWILGIPGMVSIFRAGGLNLLSHNRFVFAASFAILALAVIGLEAIRERSARWHWGLVTPVLAVCLLGIFCAKWVSELPEPLAHQLELRLKSGAAYPNIPDLDALQQARRAYRWSQSQAVGLCGAALLLWAGIGLGAAQRAWFSPLITVLVLGELLFFTYGRNPQCDPALYYPRLPLLDRLKRAESVGDGLAYRILGMNCLPANLSMVFGLRSLTGYDSVDPRPLADILDPVRDVRQGVQDYSRLGKYAPIVQVEPGGSVRLPPVLSMLGVRYLICRGKPRSTVKPYLLEYDYWALENKDALPRAFVPRRVVRAPDDKQLLNLLTAFKFDPRQVAYVAGEFSLPGDCRGRAEVVAETPREVTVIAEMETAGLVVLSDLWYPGWLAYRNGESVPIWRVNHAIRGISVPAGKSTIVFRYEPESFAWGVRLMLAGLAGAVAWIGVALWGRKDAVRR
jgi:hypothetical protein